MKTGHTSMVVVVSTIALLATGCSQTFRPWGDESTLVLAWSIAGTPADATTCSDAGATTVRMAINREPVEWFDSRLEWECAEGGAYLDSMFRTGSFQVRWDLLDADGEVITSTEWAGLQLDEGETHVEDIDF